MIRSAVLLTLSALSACAPDAPTPEAPAASTEPAELIVRDAYVPAAPAGGTGALYFTITGGPGADTLLAADLPGAAQTVLHEAFDAGGGMRGMRAVPGVPVPAGETVTLAPGGTHAMLVGLTAALTPGDTLDATLTFARSGSVRVRAAVKPVDELPTAPSPLPR
jgi:hypothetical protein